MGRKDPRASQSLVRTRWSESEMAGGSLLTGTALFHAWHGPASALIRPRHGPAHNPAGPARLRWGTLGLHGPSPDRADGGPCPPIPAWGSQHRTHDSESPANARPATPRVGLPRLRQDRPAQPAGPRYLRARTGGQHPDRSAVQDLVNETRQEEEPPHGPGENSCLKIAGAAG